MYSEMKAPERIEKGVKLELKKKQKGFLGLGDSNGKMIQFNDKNTAEVCFQAPFVYHYH